MHSLEEALGAGARGAGVAVIGGEEIFRLALPLARRIYLTEVHASVAGDTYFRALDRTAMARDRAQRAPCRRAPRLRDDFLTLERVT